MSEWGKEYTTIIFGVKYKFRIYDKGDGNLSGNIAIDSYNSKEQLDQSILIHSQLIYEISRRLGIIK